MADGGILTVASDTRISIYSFYECFIYNIFIFYLITFTVEEIYKATHVNIYNVVQRAVLVKRAVSLYYMTLISGIKPIS